MDIDQDPKFAFTFARREFGKLLVGGATVLALGGCGGLNPYRFKAKLTVNVDTPDGLRTGSSVYEFWANYRNPGTLVRVFGQIGEAVTVNLPNGKVLFSLVVGIVSILNSIDADYDNTIVESTKKLSEYGNSGPYIVAPADYPTFVTFDDIMDPMTIKRVNPANISELFGDGYRLHSVKAQITTDEDKTVGIEKRLKWLDHLETYQTDPKNPFTSTLPPEIGGLRES